MFGGLGEGRNSLFREGDDPNGARNPGDVIGGIGRLRAGEWRRRVAVPIRGSQGTARDLTRTRWQVGAIRSDDRSNDWPYPSPDPERPPYPSTWPIRLAGMTPSRRPDA